MVAQIKRLLQSVGWIDELWGVMRRWQLHAAYRARRERYAGQSSDFCWSPETVERQVRRRLAERGWTVTPRKLGEIHTFAFIPRISWHEALYPDLEELGPVSYYDYAARGYTWDEFRRGGRRAVVRRRAMLEEFLAELQAAHRRRPVDWVFVYASGVEITCQVVKKITETIGAPAVNMCLDDKQSWEGPKVDGCRFGQIDLAREFDLSWTSASVACQWYAAEGGRPYYLPEGFNSRCFRPMPVRKDIPVSFIGGAYGFRRSLVRHLARYGIHVACFGDGWKNPGVTQKQMVRIINRSIINLGAGGIGYSEMLTNVKTRDFEIPGTGGGMYLTTFNYDLAKHFRIGEEIVCYHSRDDLIEQIRYYLRHPEEAEAMAARARARCLREHRWLHRYLTLCRVLGIWEPVAEEEPCHAGSRDVGRI
ncbi:MAG: hypothetical protein KatS3mg110_1718 [Pirellulaceae bacterium]|nr:MAG: hypothetical protein KatS3mg110_1718 [Pirellulaceae bacterium]